MNIFWGEFILLSGKNLTKKMERSSRGIYRIGRNVLELLKEIS